MTDLQKHNQGLSLPDDMLLVKVPDNLYQQWYSFAQHWLAQGTPIHVRQADMYALLCEWLRNDHPGYSMVTFEDLSADEAAVLARKTGKPITWGMYVLLQKGGSMSPISITDKLLEL